MLNALERLACSYDQEVAAAGQDLALTEGQLRDYEARRGKPFHHDTYLVELERVRDALKDALSGRHLGSDKEPQPSVTDLADRIKQLQAAHTIDADPRRPLQERVSTAEEPITARVRRRIQFIVGREPQMESDRNPSEVSKPPAAVLAAVLR